MCDVTFKEILFFYGEWQSAYEEDLGEIKYQEGLPSREDLMFSDNLPRLIILDDLMRECSNDNGVIGDLFVKGSHHKNLSVICLMQNVFSQGKAARTNSLNTHYLVLFKNPRDRSQIIWLSQQIYPEDKKFLQEAYADATSKPHGYIFIDLKQSTPDRLRFKTNVFPFDEYHYVYVPRKQI